MTTVSIIITQWYYTHYILLYHDRIIIINIIIVDTGLTVMDGSGW